MPKSKYTRSLSLYLILGAFLTGCGGDSIETYRVPKQVAQEPVRVDDPHQGAAGLHWNVPDSWTTGQPGEMRLGSYATRGGGDVSIIALPDSSDLANVNRWLDQVGKPAVSEEDLASLKTVISTGMGPAQRYFLPGDGPDERAILAAILRTPGSTYFFKMDGPRSVLEQEAKTFDQFVASAHPEHPIGPPVAESQPPAATDLLVNQRNLDTDDPSGPGSMRMLPGMQESLDAIPDASWKAPADWESTMPRPGRKGSFSITTTPSSAPVDFSITALAGSAGGLIANVNRWQRQIGAAPLTPDVINTRARSLEVDGYPATLIALTPPDPGPEATGILAGLVTVEGVTWFFKMTGPQGSLKPLEPQLEQFLATVDFNPSY